MADTDNIEPLVIIPVVIRATRLMMTNFQKNQQLISVKVTLLELQIEVIMDTVSMLKRALG